MQVSEGAKRAVARIAQEQKTGARGLKGILVSIPIVFELEEKGRKMK